MSPWDNNKPQSSFSSPSLPPLTPPKSESQPYRMWHRVRRGALRGLCVGVAAFFIANLYTSWLLNRELNAIRQRGEPLRLTELAPPQIPDSENAARVYQQAFGAMKLTNQETDALRNSTAAVADPVLLAKNAQAIELTRHAAEMHSCRFPVDYEAANLAGILLSHLTKMRQLSYLLREQAVLEARSGHAQAALDDISALFRMSEHLAPEPILISGLVSVAIETVGYKTLAQVLDTVPLTPLQAQEFVKRFPHTDWSVAIDREMQGERCFGLWAFQYVSNPIEACQILDGSLRRNLVTRSLGVLWAPLWKLDEIQYLHARDRAAEAIRTPGTLKPGEDASERDLPWYAICTKIMLPDLSRVGQRRDELMAYRGMAQVALALNACRTARGHQAVTLSEAETFWSASLPQDPFSGQPFLYRLQGEKYLLYSIGPNHKDDGGKKAQTNKSAASEMQYNGEARQTDRVAADDLLWWN